MCNLDRVWCRRLVYASCSISCVCSTEGWKICLHRYGLLTHITGKWALAVTWISARSEGGGWVSVSPQGSQHRMCVLPHSRAMRTKSEHLKRITWKLLWPTLGSHIATNPPRFKGREHGPSDYESGMSGGRYWQTLFGKYDLPQNKDFEVG